MTDQAETGIDWEDAFANGAYIDGAETYPPRWAAQASAFRDAAPGAELDLGYGDGARERLDLFHPAGPPRGLVIFVHGGFWRAFDKSSWSHLAQGAVAAGYAVALPSYTLAPEASLPEMTRQIAAATECAAARVAGPICLTGHSAGGHLVSRMICDDTPLDMTVVERISDVMSISGLHDLRPLRLHSMNEVLGLTAETARSESAALHRPVGTARVTAWVGARERPEFLRQSALLAESWSDAGAEMIAEHGRHHFDVIDGLAQQGSALLRHLLNRT